MRRLLIACVAVAIALTTVQPSSAQEWPRYPYCQRVHNFVSLRNPKGRAPEMQKQNPLDQRVAMIVFPWQMCYNPFLGPPPDYPGRLAWTKMWSVPTTSYGWSYDGIIDSHVPWGCARTCNSLAHYIQWKFHGPPPYMSQWYPCALLIFYASGWVRVYGDHTGGSYCADLAQGRP